ncbi:MAG: 4Fe-4S dicluster domain-containing protein [Armatimonadetes bacterium]|nr:4Fe-4S dicluster domain-containing protein [Armatimonadota bacterium]
MSERQFYLDPSRCIGCNACVQACAECDTHPGVSMIHLEQVQRADTVQTTPIICMHCDEPACAMVCPADAIKKTPDGVVQSSLKPRCIGCTNCVFACPFGVPKYDVEVDQMMKCDMCYDRTSIELKPMCATVCPSGALFYGTPEELAAERSGTPINEFIFGLKKITTKVHLMMPQGTKRLAVKPNAVVRRSDLLTAVRQVER